jgi:hypothetical protein
MDFLNDQKTTTATRIYKTFLNLRSVRSAALGGDAPPKPLTVDVSRPKAN